jgi:hypothetical protein
MGIVLSTEFLDRRITSLAGYPFTLACEATSRLFLKNFWRVVSQAFLGRLTTGVEEVLITLKKRSLARWTR